MPSISTRASRLACVVVFAALCLIGWVAKATLAQNQAEKPASPAPPDASPAAPPLPQETDIPNVGAAKPATRTHIDIFPAPALPPGFRDPYDSAPPPPQAEPGIGPTKVPLSEPSSPDANTAEDPEKAAVAFVEQNQKQAESQLKNLKDEEANLQARLRKVEAGIKRWESFLGALKQSQGLDAASKSPVESPRPPFDKK